MDKTTFLLTQILDCKKLAEKNWVSDHTWYLAPSPASGSDTSNPLKKELESEKQQQLVLEGQIREQRAMVNDLKACQNKRNKLQEVFNKAEKLQAVCNDLTFRLKKVCFTITLSFLTFYRQLPFLYWSIFNC